MGGIPLDWYGRTVRTNKTRTNRVSPASEMPQYDVSTFALCTSLVKRVDENITEINEYSPAWYYSLLPTH